MRVIRSWVVHNLVGHPLSELAYWAVRPFDKEHAEVVSGWIHDATLPTHTEGTGRG
jgi:hypothetical protein